MVSSLYAAQSRGVDLDGGTLVEELERTRPLSVVMAEQVQGLRRWAEDRTVSAD